jgi:anti-sigma B factor antagonist
MAEDFRKKLLKLAQKGIIDLIIELIGVEMVDSVGLGVLIATHNSLNSLRWVVG